LGETLDFSEEENIRLLMLNILKALKYFYSFKELESLLEISSQVLWRYLSFRAVPEKETALKIIEKVKEKKLVQKILDKLKESEELEIDVTNPGVLLLAYLKLANEKWANDAMVIITKDDPFSIAISTVLALNFRAKLCVASPKIFSKNYIYEVYASSTKEIKAYALSRKCIQRKDKVLISLYECEAEECLSLINLASRLHANVNGLFVFKGNREKLRVIIERNLDLKIPVETLLETL
jgi:hypothetical protein